MQIYFHSRLCSYLPRVPILVEGTVYIKKMGEFLIHSLLKRSVINKLKFNELHLLELIKNIYNKKYNSLVEI